MGGEVSAHSPSPWVAEAVNNNERHRVCDARGALVASVGHLQQDLAEEAANAHLVAAAPDLLAFVRKYARLYANAWPDDEFDMVVEARLLIASASVDAEAELVRIVMDEARHEIVADVSPEDARKLADIYGTGWVADSIRNLAAQIERLTGRDRASRETRPSSGDLDPMFRALAAGEISIGRAREIVQEWRVGRPWVLPDDTPDRERNSPQEVNPEG